MVCIMWAPSCPVRRYLGSALEIYHLGLLSLPGVSVCLAAGGMTRQAVNWQRPVCRHLQGLTTALCALCGAVQAQAVLLRMSSSPLRAGPLLRAPVAGLPLPQAAPW